ncbi:thioredoxin domain-containing protein [Arenicella sp. 4NH20-0111]|uniref:thioredoxin domain-containing protein n=1 Tax=Arenicella sp. 4NH20-0111 TaxID=3127648 RepID=UPI0033414281
MKLTSTLIICLLGFNLLIPHAVAEENLRQIYNDKKDSYTLSTKHVDKNGNARFVNHLIKQNSLYLLQHANNPVNWWAWAEDAFKEAARLNKPIFLSIGYSTCHWCHVMARESFDNIETANFINDNFIPIKVDREEYPDIDELYLTSVQMLSGKAGWPLTAVLTPDGKAFFGGTYFQPEALINVLSKIDQTWRERQDAVLAQAERLNTALKGINKASKAAESIDAQIILEAAKRIDTSLSQTESELSKPGFPREPEMLFLLHHGLKTQSKSAIQTVSNRLLTLAASGLHDHVGGGFHRYTVDSNWNIPHFEKMLYNQAQMGKAYIEAYALTGNQALKDTASKTFSFLLETMQSPHGGFYAAMDAESEDSDGNKTEGAYYLWSHSELTDILSKNELEIAEAVFGVSRQGNFTGSNVIKRNPDNFNEGSNSVLNRQQAVAVLDKLTAARATRKPPHTDTKIITSWNSMAISALLAGYQVTAEEEYLQAAKKAADRIWKLSYQDTGTLKRTLSEDSSSVLASLEDYAYFSNALLDAFDILGDTVWLERSKEVAKQMIEYFHDSETGGFKISSSIGAKVPILRLVTARDDATFSGNSMAAQVLVRLYHRTGKVLYKNTANQTIAAFSNQLFANPEALSGMLLAASKLNSGEVNHKQYAAKGNIAILSKANAEGGLEIKMAISDGWHVNASQVLGDYLIPTKLISTPQTNCSPLSNISYPDGNLVSLGFQEEKLLVYEGQTMLIASQVKPHKNGCRVLSAQLKIQACTDEICLAPETIPIRTSTHIHAPQDK